MEDLIKREDAERYIYSLIPIKQDADEIVKAIKVIPSADRPSIDEQAEEILNQIYDAVNGINALLDRPQGEWIDIGWKGDWQFETDGRGNCWYEYECSECGFHSKGSKSNFCPHCGARMKGADDE